MAVDEAAIAARVADELARIADEQVVAALRKYLIPPRSCLLDWDYGPEAQYRGYVVAEFPEKGTGIAYSEYGFGPTSPWVLIWLDRPGFGMDSSAFTTLADAFADQAAPPPGMKSQPRPDSSVLA